MAAPTGGQRAWVLRDDVNGLQATWLPGAGMLGGSLRHDGDELLWQGRGVEAYVRERAFMGIPFLHPWANRLAGFAYRAGGHEVALDPSSPLLLCDQNGLPIHGVSTASRRWSVRDPDADDEGARLVAVLSFDHPDLLAAFPFPHEVEMEVEVRGGALRVTTTVTPTGAEAVPVAFGFHPYLRIPNVPRARWEVSFPVSRRLEVDERLIPTGVTQRVSPIIGEIGDRTWDDGFDQIEKGSRFELSGGGRTIVVEYTDGYPVAQIFAPPEQEYVCVEPMTAATNALASGDSALGWVTPGQSRSATFKISCS
jgi:galactose mutarotase-like enzyme